MLSESPPGKSSPTLQWCQWWYHWGSLLSPVGAECTHAPGVGGWGKNSQSHFLRLVQNGPSEVRDDLVLPSPLSTFLGYSRTSSIPSPALLHTPERGGRGGGILFSPMYAMACLVRSFRAWPPCRVGRTERVRPVGGARPNTKACPPIGMGTEACVCLHFEGLNI